MYIHRILFKPIALQLHFWEEELVFAFVFVFFFVLEECLSLFLCLWGVSFPLSLSVRLPFYIWAHGPWWPPVHVALKFNLTTTHCTAGWVGGATHQNRELWPPLVGGATGVRTRTATSWAKSRVFQQKDFDTQTWIINWFNEAYFHQCNCHICVIRQMLRNKLFLVQENHHQYHLLHHHHLHRQHHHHLHRQHHHHHHPRQAGGGGHVELWTVKLNLRPPDASFSAHSNVKQVNKNFWKSINRVFFGFLYLNSIYDLSYASFSAAFPFPL